MSSFRQPSCQLCHSECLVSGARNLLAAGTPSQEWFHTPESQDVGELHRGGLTAQALKRGLQIGGNGRSFTPFNIAAGHQVDELPIAQNAD